MLCPACQTNYIVHPLYSLARWTMRMQELGLDCVAWAPPVYHDLLRSGDGTAEGIVAAYFGMVSPASSDSYSALQIATVL